MESTPQEEAEGQAIVRVLAVVLQRLVSANSHLAASEQEETKFHALRAPAIGILQYLERIYKYASCSKECFILALIYIDRLIQRNNFPLTDLNVHRVVITAVLLAAKFFDDAYYNNAYYAKVGGVLVSEMNTLEVEFLFKIDFSLRVLPEVFDKYRDELISHSSAMGLDRIASCTDEELFGQGGVKAPAQLQQQYQLEQQVQARVMTQDYAQPGVPAVSSAAAPQVSLLHAYSQTEFVDPSILYHHPNRATAVPPTTALPENHYPIQALRQSMMVPHVAQESLQQQQQQPTAGTDHQVCPFPTLAHQVSVSVQQQSQARPAQNHTELNQVYHNITPAAAPLDVSLCQQYTSQLSLHDSAAAVSAPQAQVYYTVPAPPPEVSSSANFSILGIQAAAAAHHAPSVYSQQHATSYNFNTGPSGVQVGVQAVVNTAHCQPSMAQQSHPEITPSPPPQPPINIHGAPAMASYHEGTGNPRGTGVAFSKTKAAVSAMPVLHTLPQQRYSTPANAALDLHLHHHNVQILPSRPIAIMPQSGGAESWSRMISLEARGPNGSDLT